MNKWMIPANVPEQTYVTVYRCCFEVFEAQTLEFKFSADNHAQLFLDGQWIINGPERGAAEYWYYQNCKVQLTAGKHILTARVICAKPLDVRERKYAYAQMSVSHGFYIDEPSGLLKNWEYQIENISEFEIPFPDWGAFPRVHLTPDYNSDIYKGQGGEWLPVEYFEDKRILHAPELPLMRHEKTEPVKKSDSLYYFEEYTCAWANYHFSGKGTVKIRWFETPYMTEEYDDIALKGVKGKRNGSHIVGNFDVFEVDGELEWYDFWWRAGHYWEIQIDGAVTCKAEFFRTGYPYEKFEPRSQLEKMAFETLQACSFETYMDCPYYEQLMYIGDSRLEALCTYLITDDHRLIRKALRMLSLSQRPDGSLNAQYPSCSIQTIPSFMLIWLLMLSDYYKHHGNDDLVAELRPKALKLLDYFRKMTDDDLLVIQGWNFLDWCQEWKHGVPPGEAVNSAMNLLYILTLQRMAEMNLCDGLDEEIKRITAKVREKFYDCDRQLYASDIEKRHFSEHSQALALLTLGDTSVINGLQHENLVPCSIYFSYYYLEACQKYGLDDLLEKRLDRWRMLGEEGLTTFPEEFDNPRSDCHAWSSHILGILLQR